MPPKKRKRRVLQLVPADEISPPRKRKWKVRRLKIKKYSVYDEDTKTATESISESDHD